jgi:class 3 adenylate cyclase
VATKAIFRYDGTLDKLVGDQVMAFFWRARAARRPFSKSACAALEIVREIMTGAETSLRVGAGISTGEAAAGEILISQETYSQIASEYPAAIRRGAFAQRQK